MTPSFDKAAPPMLLRPVDVLALGFVAALLVLAGVAWSRGMTGAPVAAARLCGSAALIVLLRSARTIRVGRLGELLAALAPMGLVPIDWALNPITDLVNPIARDPELLHADRVLFGETPSVTLQGLLTPLFTEALMLCYFAFFALVLAPAILFWLRRERAAMESYVQAVVLFFVTNLAFYLVVPATGPRFVIAEQYAQPLHAVLFGDSIREMFLNTPYFRDCFPSGHTAGTLVALWFTARRMPRFFFVALPVGALCICATVLCRFHYAVDLLAALPLAFWALRASRGLDSWAFLPNFPGVVAEARPSEPA
jgi:membrane-associated phospholipid phosphatase